MWGRGGGGRLTSLMWVYSLVKQQKYMLTVYCTRWIRQRFTTIYIYNINSTYSHRNWCVYVLYPWVMTITRGGASLGRGGGLLSKGGEIPQGEWKDMEESLKSKCLSRNYKKKSYYMYLKLIIWVIKAYFFYF